MKKMITNAFVVAAVFAATVTFAMPEVTDVVAKQRYPWNGLVDITCKVTGINGVTNGLYFTMAAVDPDSGIANGVWYFRVIRDGANLPKCEVNTNGNYRLLWNALADLGEVNYSNMVVRVTLGENKGGNIVQLWEGGPYWAETNIGADAPWESGYYFWWGDTIGYKRENEAWVASDGSSSNFSFGSGNTPTDGKSISTLQSEGWIRADSVLVPEHDAAYVHWGSNWRMPTIQELGDLIKKCDWTWTMTNGVNGYLVCGTGDYASASIFLPASGWGDGTSLWGAGSYGYSWSSVPYPGDGSRYLDFNNMGVHDTYSSGRYLGRCVRPVGCFRPVGRAGDSMPFRLDTRCGTRVAQEVEEIAYSTAWETDVTGATAVISINGEEFSATEGEGSVEWRPPCSGTYMLTHSIFTNGVQVGETLTTIFMMAPSPWFDFGFYGTMGDETWIIMTNNVTHTVQFTDDLGEVVLDLNGHSIMGESASAGIQITHGAGTGTHLKIIDSQQTGTATVCGGNTRGAGVDVRPGAVDVLISVGEKVTVSGGEGGVGVNGDVDENHGTISGGNGKNASWRDWDSDGGAGGCGVKGHVAYNQGIISGGSGGWGYGDDGCGGRGGNGGDGISGDLEMNSGVISGGAGGSGGYDWGDAGDGGDGGIGVRGTVGTNMLSGVISGGDGGGAAEEGGGHGGGGGHGVQGDVRENDGIISGGNGTYRYNVWEECAPGGDGVVGSVIKNEGTVSYGIGGGAFASALGGTYTYNGNSHDFKVTISNLPPWYALSSATIGGVAVTPIFLGNGNYEVRLTWPYADAGSYSPIVCLVATNIMENYVNVNEITTTITITSKDVSGMVCENLPSYIYANCAYTPKPVVTDTERNVTLVEGTDYTLSYANNVNVGTATVTVNGEGNYSGSISDTFTIVRRDIADATIMLGAALTYNGQEQTQSISNVKVDGLNVTYTASNNKATDPGSYTLTVTGTGNFTGTATKQFSIARKSIAGATVNLGGGLTYTGSPQSQGVSSVVIDGLNATFDVSGNSATAAGNYTLTVTGTGKFTGSTTKQFSIARKSLTMAMVGAIGKITYTGSAQTPRPVVTDSARGVTLAEGTDYTLSYANNALAGTATVTVTGKGNYTGAISKNFTIDKQTVPQPAIASREYTGGQQVATISSSTLYDIVQNAGGVDVGQYDVKLRLVDSANYTWPDVTGADLTLKFSITKATNAWTVEPSIAGWTYGQAASLPNMGSAKFGSATVTYGAMGTSRPTDAGNYTATFTVAGTANYSGLSKPVQFTIAKATYNMGSARWDYAGAFTYDGSVKTVGVSGLPLGVTVSGYSGNTAILTGTYTAHATLAYDTVNYNEPTLADLVWEIKSGDLQKIEDVFEDLPVTIGPDGAGGWTVKLTNDVDSADLPLEIPDNLGQVTLDLNGHDLVGANGRAGGALGESALPGEDGKPAIRIVPGGGGGDVTRLTLVTTGGDSLVKGGDGGTGNPGGNGAPGIEVADGVQGGVKIDVGVRVTVRGGDGGASEAGCGGDGGAGIDGNVGTNDGTIIGGNGGDSVSGDGGDGGMGVTGDVGTNNGTISGGTGGVSAQGENGDDGVAVGGTIGGGTGTVRKVKVAVPEVPSAAYTGEVVEPQVPASALYAVSASGGTQSGSYPVMLTLLDFTNYEWIPREGVTINGALAVVNFVILNPPPTITVDDGGQSGAANAASYVGVYDGEGHGISVRVTYPATGCTVRYATAASGPFTDDVPLFTDVVTGAETWYEVSAAGFDPVTNVATVTITPRNLSGASLGSLRFTGTGGARTPVATLVDDLGHVIAAENYTFDWTEEASGALSLSFTGRGNYLGLFETRLAQTRFTVTFDTNGGVFGEGVEATAEYDIGTYYGVLPVPARAGYLFDGWYEHADFSGSPVTRNTEVVAADLTLHAKWLRRALWYTDVPFHLEGAVTYDGYLIDQQAADAVVGTISVKAGKPGRNGQAKTTVTVLLAGKKKATLKGSTIDGKVSGTVGGMALDMTLGFSSMSGTLGRYAIDGTRNVFTAKDADSKLTAAQALKRWQGVYVAAWEGPAGWNGLSLEVKAKGKVKVTGVLADGTKVSASSQLLVGERECALAVSYTKKSASVACLVWLCADGTVECGNMRGGASALIANARSGARLSTGSAFRTGSEALAGAVPGLLIDLMPDGLEVRMKGMAFDIDKAGRAKLLKDKSGVDPSGLGTNPSGLKLKYTMKNGTFKGSFSAYALDGGKLKKVRVQVSGVVLGGRGYGTASVKRPLVSWPVEIR